MLPDAAIFSQILTGSGAVAATMAIGIFVGQVQPSLVGGPDSTLRRRATLGGLIGLGFGIVVVVLSVVTG